MPFYPLFASGNYPQSVIMPNKLYCFGQFWQNVAIWVGCVANYYPYSVIIGKLYIL